MGRDMRNKRRIEGCSTSCQKNVTVTVVVVAFDPTFDNRRINPALEIAVSDFEELVASQYSPHSNFVFREHRQDLARSVIIRTHDLPPVYELAATISDGNQAGSGSSIYPLVIGRL